METRFDIGDGVRVIRSVRDDGTYPGSKRGELLVRRGNIGTVVDVGTFLGDQIIYAVHFLDTGRIVGCREEELIGVDEEWFASRFETRERIMNTRALAIDGEIRVAVGSRGEILKVLRNTEQGVVYHVLFECLSGRPLIVREAALSPLSGSYETEAEHA